MEKRLLTNESSTPRSWLRVVTEEKQLYAAARHPSRLYSNAAFRCGTAPIWVRTREISRIRCRASNTSWFPRRIVVLWLLHALVGVASPINRNCATLLFEGAT